LGYFLQKKNQNKEKMRKDGGGMPIKNIDDYLFQLPDNQRIALEELRQTIRETAPKAEEVISYGMPAFKHHGMLVYFAAFKTHCSFFVGNGSLVAEMGDALQGYKTVKSGIHFTVDNPLPAELIRTIVLKRIAKNEEKMRTKKGKKPSE
jgi:uncharacterized protein YdhG (YjbR/CyaY superfamily)